MGDRQGQVLLGKYRLDSMLGQGGMGSVFAGTNLRTGRRVAIKLLDERFLENGSIVQRFGREARAASAIEHPGIVEVLDLDQTEDGVPFLVMEYLDGETLAARVERKKKLTQAEAVEIFVPLLEALDAAHARGIVHRDIKPDNIYLLPPRAGGAPRVKLLDFGISQKSDEVRSHLTQTGAVLGTPHYMSPEQALGESALDARADLYAIGIVLYECVVGDVPYDAPNYNALLQTILRHTPKSPRERGAQIDAGFEDVIMRAMAKDRDARPSSAHALSELLQAAANAGSAPGAARAPSARPTPSASSSWGDAPTLKSGEAVVRRPSPIPARPASLAPATPVVRPAVQAGTPGRSFDELDLAGPALELDHAPMAARTSQVPSADQTGPRRPVSATFRSPSQSGMQAQRPQSSGAIPAVRPPSSDGIPSPSLPAPPSPPSPSPLPSSTPPVEAREDGTPERGGLLAFIPQRARLPLAVGLALVVAIIVVRIAFRPKPNDDGGLPVAQPTTGLTTTTTPGVELVSVEVVGLPPGAVVRLDGLPAATMPMHVRRGTHHVLTVTAPGYVQRAMEITVTGEMHVPADMRPLLGTQ